MFLINRLLHGVEGYLDGDLRANTRRCLYAKTASEFPGTLFHDWNAEVPAK